MKTDKIILAILCAIGAVVFWYFGQPHKPEKTAAPAALERPVIETPGTESRPTASSAPASAPVSAPRNVDPETKIQLPSRVAAPRVGTGSPPPAPQIGTLVATPDHPPTLEPDKKMDALRITMHNFGQRFRGNPVGNNAEITAALKGGNPGGVNFLGDGLHTINDRGELCDDWGTPYFFHQLSGTEMEIRSAGPDKKMWTDDDLMIR